MRNVTIAVSVYSSDNGDTYYVSGVTGKWEKELIEKFGGSKTDRGSIKFTRNPQEDMTKMGIRYEFFDKRDKTSSSGGSNGGDGAEKPLSSKVWKHGDSVCVRFPYFKDDENLREDFKRKFGASWDKEAKLWVVKNSTFSVSDIEKYLGLEGLNKNHTTSGGGINFLLTKDEVVKFQAMLSHLQAGGVVSIAS